MHQETRYRVHIWYKAGTLRAHVVTMDFYSLTAAECYVRDLLPPWYRAATRTLRVVPTITEVVS